MRNLHKSTVKYRLNGEYNRSIACCDSSALFIGDAVLICRLYVEYLSPSVEAQTIAQHWCCCQRQRFFFSSVVEDKLKLHIASEHKLYMLPQYDETLRA